MTNRQKETNHVALDRSLDAVPESLSAQAELLSLAADSLALAQEVDSLSEKNRLIRAALALLNAVRGDVHDTTGEWQNLGDVARRVIARL